MTGFIRKAAAVATAVATVSGCFILTGAVSADNDNKVRTVSGQEPTRTQTLYDGVSYSYYSLPSNSSYDAKDFSVVEFDLAQTDLYFDVVSAGKYSDEKKPTSTIVKNFNANNTEGKEVIAAINADLWMVGYCHARQNDLVYNGIEYKQNMKKTVTLPRGFNVSDGEIISSAHIEQETPFEGDFLTFGVTSDYVPFMCDPGVNVTIKNNTKNSSLETNAINRLPVENATVVYTDKGCLNNYALDDAYEVVIDFDSDYKIQHGTNITGTVTGIYGPDSTDNPTMQENRIIITSRNSRTSAQMRTLRRYAVGDSVTLNVETFDKWGKYTDELRDIQEGTGGHIPIVIDGDYCYEYTCNLTNLYATSIVGYTADGTVMFLTLDSVESTSSSKYFRINQMPYLAKELGLVNAFLLDGGGSATMVTLDGSEYKLQGTPSDGNERSVINAIVLSHGPKRSEQGEFTPAQPIYYSDDASRLIFEDGEMLKYIKNEYNSEASYDSTERAAKLNVTNGFDPHVDIKYSLAENTLSADTYKYAVLTYKNPLSNSSLASMATMFLCADNVTAASGDMMVTVPLERSDSYTGCVIDLSRLSYWKSWINMIRFDFFEEASEGDVFYFDSLILCENRNEAKNILAQRIKAANADPSVTETPTDTDSGRETDPIIDPGTETDPSVTEIPTDTDSGRETDPVVDPGTDSVTEAPIDTDPIVSDTDVPDTDPIVIVVGDVNGDGIVNSKDLTRLMKFIAGEKVDVPGWSDINGDGVTNAKDLTRLMKMIAGS